MFENLATPTFVYDRSGSIRYVNPAFRALTGFNLPLPTPISDYSFYVYILSQNGVKEYLDIMFNFMENFTSMLSSSGFMFKSGVRVFDNDVNGPEKSIDGELATKCRVDIFRNDGCEF
jgi:PAS domain-containing protein